MGDFVMSIVAGIAVLAACSVGIRYIWAGKRAAKAEAEKSALQHTGKNPHAKWI